MIILKAEKDTNVVFKKHFNTYFAKPQWPQPELGPTILQIKIFFQLGKIGYEIFYERDLHKRNFD